MTERMEALRRQAVSLTFGTGLAALGILGVENGSDFFYERYITPLEDKTAACASFVVAHEAELIEPNSYDVNCKTFKSAFQPIIVTQHQVSGDTSHRFDTVPDQPTFHEFVDDKVGHRKDWMGIGEDISYGTAIAAGLFVKLWISHSWKNRDLNKHTRPERRHARKSDVPLTDRYNLTPRLPGQQKPKHRAPKEPKLRPAVERQWEAGKVKAGHMAHFASVQLGEADKSYYEVEVDGKTVPGGTYYEPYNKPVKIPENKYVRWIKKQLVGLGD